MLPKIKLLEYSSQKVGFFCTLLLLFASLPHIYKRPTHTYSKDGGEKKYRGKRNFPPVFLTNRLDYYFNSAFLAFFMFISYTTGVPTNIEE